MLNFLLRFQKGKAPLARVYLFARFRTEVLDITGASYSVTQILTSFNIRVKYDGRCKGWLNFPAALNGK